MSRTLNVVTGATGLLGSHVVEQLVLRGRQVRAIVRANSDTSFLRLHGVEARRVELNDTPDLRSALEGADVVYHCAARVSDWGPWREFQTNVIDICRNLLDACQTVGVGRLLHVSSSRVYGHPRGTHRQISENERLGQKLGWLWDYYPRAKIETERMCREYRGPWTIVRPTWAYGMRDRNTLPRILRTVQFGQAMLIGSGDNLLNIIAAGDVADGIIRAGEDPKATGQVYNLGAAERLTQRQFFGVLTDALGQPPLRRRIPYSLAYGAGFLVEVVGKTFRVKRNLRVTRHGVKLLGDSVDINCDKARDQLAWTPTIHPQEGLLRTVSWYFQEGGGLELISQKPKSWIRRRVAALIGK